jgi:hypothetical protein
MRKEARFVFAFAVLFLFVAGFMVVGAAEDNGANAGVEGDGGVESGVKETAGNITQTAKDKAGEFTGEIKEGVGEAVGGVKNKTEDILEKEVAIPEALQLPARIVFGIKSDPPIKIGELVVLLAIWIVVFTLVLMGVKITPFFKGDYLPYLAGLAMTIIIALTGIINSIAIFFFNLGNLFVWMEALGPFQIVIGLGLALFILWVGHKGLSILQRHMGFEAARESGREVGRAIGISRGVTESVEEAQEEE